MNVLLAAGAFWLGAMAWLAYEVKRAPDAKDALPHAMVCAWCREPATEADAWLADNGAEVSHFLCADCRRKHFSEVEES